MAKELSVVMSAYQRGHALVKTLPTLINQEIPPDEIIIIDDGSTDETAEVVQKFQKVYPEANIKYFYNNHPGWTICVHGMNCGIKKATKEIIMLTMPEILHVNQDVKISLDWFNRPENDKTLLDGADLYGVDDGSWNDETRILFKKLTEENFRNPITITQRPEVHTWYNGYISKPGTITFYPKGALHHIAGVLKKHLVAIGGYDEGFLDGGAGGYDDIDLLGRLSVYGLGEVKTEKFIAIHLPHDWPPAYARDPKVFTKNYERMTSRKKGTWKVNIGKEWGVLRK